MKKNWVLILTSLLVCMVIGICSVQFGIAPGIQVLNDSNIMKEFSNEEKTKLIDEINQKYILMEEKVENKYVPSIEEINLKYSELEKQIKDKYKQKEKDINEKIRDKTTKQTQEFFKNQFSQKYYDLGDEIAELNNEKWEITLQKKEEISKNDELKANELKPINSKKIAELNKLNADENNEISDVYNHNENVKFIKIKNILRIAAGIIVMLIPFFYGIKIYNKLTRLSNEVEEKWSQVDVYLKQRTDLIPNIVETVKGYANYEKETLESVIHARNTAANASNKEEEINANTQLETMINKLLFIQEDYPELKANNNFMELHESLKEIENKIARARRFYNQAVLRYKNKLEVFPSNVIANLFNFKDELFFNMDQDEKENPNINLE